MGLISVVQAILRDSAKLDQCPDCGQPTLPAEGRCPECIDRKS